LYRSSTRGPEDDSVESKHVAPLSHYMFNITTVLFDGPPLPPPLLFRYGAFCSQYKCWMKFSSHNFVTDHPTSMPDIVIIQRTRPSPNERL